MLNWKEIPKIDAHVHLMPEDVILANQGNGDPFVDFGDVGAYLKIMEENHIDMAYVMPFNDPWMLSMAFTAEAVHENLIGMAKKGKGKIKCFADLDLRMPIDKMLEELDRVLALPVFAGIKVHAANTAYPVDGDYYDAVFAYAEEKQVLVEVHAYPRPHLGDDVCAPCRILRVLERHPRLRMSVAHLGGMQAEALIGAPVYMNLSAVLPDMADGWGMAKANRVLREIGVEKLVFATDFPTNRCVKPEYIYDRYYEILGQMDFTLDEAEMICRGNAMKMMADAGNYACFDES